MNEMPMTTHVFVPSYPIQHAELVLFVLRGQALGYSGTYVLSCHDSTTGRILG